MEYTNLYPTAYSWNTQSLILLHIHGIYITLYYCIFIEYIELNPIAYSCNIQSLTLLHIHGIYRV